MESYYLGTEHAYVFDAVSRGAWFPWFVLISPRVIAIDVRLVLRRLVLGKLHRMLQHRNHTRFGTVLFTINGRVWKSEQDCKVEVGVEVEVEVEHSRV